MHPAVQVARQGVRRTAFAGTSNLLWIRTQFVARNANVKHVSLVAVACSCIVVAHDMPIMIDRVSIALLVKRWSFVCGSVIGICWKCRFLLVQVVFLNGADVSIERNSSYSKHNLFRVDSNRWVHVVYSSNKRVS